MSQVVEVVRLTLYYVLHLSAWFALAIFIAAMVDLLYLDVVARRALRRSHGWVGVVAAASVGAFSPFCSFIVIPLIRRLLVSGVPLSAVMAFWIASPSMDPEIYALSAAQIGIPLSTARLVGAVALSVGGGLIVLLLERRGMLGDVLRDRRDDRPALGAESAQPAPQAALVAVPAGAGPMGFGSAGSAPPGGGNAAGGAVGGGNAAGGEAAGCGGTGGAVACAATTGPAGPDDEEAAWWPTAKASLRSGRNWRITARNMGRDVVTLGKWLVLACFIEALVILYLPTELIAGLFGSDNPLVAIPLAALVGVPMYLNGAGAIPVVDGLLVKGMAAGAAVTFLLGGAVTTIPAMVAVRSIVQNRVFLLYLGISVAGSILIGFVVQLLFR